MFILTLTFTLSVVTSVALHDTKLLNTTNPKNTSEGVIAKSSMWLVLQCRSDGYSVGYLVFMSFKRKI